jgi:alpha-beta hydrolase superfamily lysophospholipase
MEHHESTFPGSGGLELYCQDWIPSGTPRGAVAIVHGFGDHSGRYANVVNCLVPAGYAVYGFDLRGNGRSPGQRGYINDWSEYREDVEAFLQTVRAAQPNAPLFLYGHSMGGLIALEYVLHRPQGLRAVIASSPLLMQPGISPALILLGRILSRVAPRFSLNTGLPADSISRDPAVVEAYRTDPLVHSLGTPRLSTELAAAQQWSLAHAAELSLPLLMILGSADRLSPPQGGRQFFASVTSAEKQLLEYKDAYHECHNDIIYEQAVADVKAWLDKHS